MGYQTRIWADWVKFCPLCRACCRVYYPRNYFIPPSKTLLTSIPTGWPTTVQSWKQASTKSTTVSSPSCSRFAANLRTKKSDDSKTQSDRFEKILVLMQQMQECGHPPKELAGETDLFPNPMSAAAFASGAAVPENCVIM